MITQPGLYPTVTADEYHADPVVGGSLSSSGARALLPPSCPARYHWQQINGQPAKRHFDFGHAAHRLVLGAGADLEIVQADDWRTKAAKEQRDDAYANGLTPILAAEYAVVEAMANAIRQHPVASALLDPQHGTPEQTLVWQDPSTKVMCRARFDWLPAPSRGRLIIPDYKGLPLDTPIPTPSGWTTMGALAVGDAIFGGDGRSCVVTHKSEIHSRRCYRITFDDRSTVVCDDEHLWKVTSGPVGHTTTHVLTTIEIAAMIAQGQRLHRVHVAPPLDLPHVDLPIDPYVLGCWLGDGTAANGLISKPDDELFELIRQRGYDVAPARPTDKCPSRTVYGLATQLRSIGLLGHKSIPEKYLRAATTQRLDLLRGLMDTDGSWNPTRQQAVFTSTDKALSMAVRELACTLGQRAVLHQHTAHGFGLSVTAYRVTFTPNGINPFALSRKANAVQVRSTTRASRRIITSIDDAPTVDTQCIAVDSADHTYLCTESFIPTHNTCASAEPEQLRRTMDQFGYHMQASWYLDAARIVLGARDPAFVFIAQEKQAPYIVTVWEPDYVALRIGAERNHTARNIWQQCTTTGHWPAYSDAIELLALPAWAEAREGARTT